MRKQIIGGALAALFLAACGGGTEQQQVQTQQADAGGLELTIAGPASGGSSALRNALVMGEPSAAAKVGWVSVYVEGYGPSCGLAGYANGTEWVQAPPIAFPLTATFTGIPAGCEVTIYVDAFDRKSPTPITNLYKGQATFTAASRQMGGVNLVLQQVAAPGSVQITAPMISSIGISDTTPEIGVPVTLSATVSGEGTQTYLWTATCGNEQGRFSAATSKTTDLTFDRCDTDALVTFKAEAADIQGALGSISSTVSFKLNYVKQGVVAGIDINSWPNVTFIRALDNAAPIPSGTVSLAAGVVDPDGDPLEYLWSDDCGGSFSNATVLDPVWTAPAIPAQQCVLTLKVNETNGPGKNEATLKLQVAPAILTLHPFIGVCDSTTWVCGEQVSHPNAQSSVDASALHLVKSAADGNGRTFGPNARIAGVAGLVLDTVTFDAVGTGIGAGTPWLRVNGTCNLVATSVVGSAFTFVPTSECGGVLSDLYIVADMGGLVGSVDITSVKVNGIAVQ